MEDVRNLSDDAYARYALLVMYAWDMCDSDLLPTSDVLDRRIAGDEWEVCGIITGADNIIATAPGGIRLGRIRPGPDRHRYGYLARRQGGDGSYVAVIRGTDGAEEWADDFVFVADQRPGFPGRVETGFIDIYLSMTYRPLGGAGDGVPLAQGVRDAVCGGEVLVLGHSLGSTLAEALAFQLADPGCIGSARVGAIMFASPKLGDAAFVTGFQARVANYTVINYQNDVVPLVPPIDVTHLDIYHALPNRRIIIDQTATAMIRSADKGCCHHLIDYVAMLSPGEYSRASTSLLGWTADDAKCAECVVTLRVPPPGP